MKMTTEEAFVKTLQMHGIEHAFGIIGSAFMPISDIFPQAGISFWDCAHEGSGGMMADGYTRASGKMSMKRFPVTRCRESAVAWHLWMMGWLCMRADAG